MKRYPAGTYGRQTLHYYPAPFRAPLRAFAALVFPWCGDQILLCDICDRGWCIPSGRVEADETSMEAARREAMEEAGASLCDVQYIGCYRISEREEVRWADVYVAQVASLSEITMPEESRGRRFVAWSEIPQAYYNWNDLTQAVFEHSREVIGRVRRYCGANDQPTMLAEDDREVIRLSGSIS